MDESCHQPPFTKKLGAMKAPMVFEFHNCLFGSGLANTIALLSIHGGYE